MSQESSRISKSMMMAIPVNRPRAPPSAAIRSVVLKWKKLLCVKYVGGVGTQNYWHFPRELEVAINQDITSRLCSDNPVAIWLTRQVRQDVETTNVNWPNIDDLMSKDLKLTDQSLTWLNVDMRYFYRHLITKRNLNHSVWSYLSFHLMPEAGCHGHLSWKT